jgi:hypothetical protein
MRFDTPRQGRTYNRGFAKIRADICKLHTGKHFTAIYKYENEQLTICYNLSGDSYPETFETKGKPMYFLSIFKKEMIK